MSTSCTPETKGSQLGFAEMSELKGVSMLWADGWHDGPTDGVASRGNRKYWFDAVFDTTADDYEHPRRMLLYELMDEEFRRETERHKRFEELVGNTRVCFHLPPEERHGPTQPEASWARFYDQDRSEPRPTNSERPPAGWFFWP